QQVEILSDSPNLLQKIRQQARSRAETISWNSIVDEFIQRLNSANTKVTPNGNRKTVTAKDSATVQ
ncbi:hypothetical protein Q4595_28065, partial [Wenyingzhuangia sp. 1_MG-2023]|nr:hypothetical protein [Wenyingzhuangia sp. 1_MG-2023]